MDRTNPYVIAGWRGRYGTYAVAIYGPSPGPSSPVGLVLASAPESAFGDVSRAFGGGLIASSADYRALDPTGELDRLFGDAYESVDYEVQISGPDGLGGTWGVHTRPMQGEEQGSHSPLVSPGSTVALGTHDGLATLADVDGSDTKAIGLENLFARLWEAMPGAVDQAAPGIWDILADWPIATSEQADGLVSRWRFSDEITGDAEKGDFGTIEEQLIALCEAGTLSIYQPTDSPGTWEVRTRSRVGTAGSASLLEGDGDRAAVSAAAFPNRTIALPSYTADDSGTGAGRVRRVSQLRMDGTGQIVYNIPAYGPLGDFDEQSVTIGRFTPATGLRFYLADARQETSDAGSPVTLGSYRLELAGDDAVMYYGPDWSTSAQTMTPDAATTADIPVTGTVTLLLVGEDDNLDTDNDPGTPDTTESASFAASTLSLQDEAGDPITDYAITIGEPGGQAIELALLPAVEVFDGSAWVTPSGYTDAITSRVCGSLPACTATIRLAQQGSNLRQMTAEVTGLHGPQSRFLLVGRDNGNDASPWPEDVELIPTGGEVNLDEGWTLMSLTSAKEVAP